jgi:hypothetical protein
MSVVPDGMVLGAYRGEWIVCNTDAEDDAAHLTAPYGAGPHVKWLEVPHRAMGFMLRAKTEEAGAVAVLAHAFGAYGAPVDGAFQGDPGEPGYATFVPLKDRNGTAALDVSVPASGAMEDEVYRFSPPSGIVDALGAQYVGVLVDGNGGGEVDAVIELCWVSGA